MDKLTVNTTDLSGRKQNHAKQHLTYFNLI